MKRIILCLAILVPIVACKKKDIAPLSTENETTQKVDGTNANELKSSIPYQTDNNSTPIAIDETLTLLNAPTYPLIQGTIIGTPGSYSGSETRDKVFDGDTYTYVDANQPNGAWVGLDLGYYKTIHKIEFVPRWGWGDRMRGGKFQISDDPSFANPLTIYTIPSDANLQFPNVYEVASTNIPITARYIRYLSPDGGWCNVGEIRFFGS